MAKRRSGTQQGRSKKTSNRHQSVSRKKSSKRTSDLPKAAYSEEALETGSAALSASSSEPERGSREDLWNLNTKVADQFVQSAIKNGSRAFNIAPSPGTLQSEPSAPTLFAVPSSFVSRNGVQAITRELINQFTRQAQNNFEAMIALGRSRSPQDLFKVQSDLALGSFENIVNAARRVSIIAVQMAGEAGRNAIPRMRS